MKGPYRNFQTFGVELEYMIVREGTLDVLPIADEILPEDGEFQAGSIGSVPYAWSNELARHVVEVKTSAPIRRLDGLSSAFHEQVERIQKLLASKGARLLPSAMHPWMNPETETQLWPHGSREIYEAFNRIFNCSGHGWSNLQSSHLNIGFSGEKEFLALHRAVRLVLPLIPAMAASSPYRDGQAAKRLDERIEMYRHNCDRVPSVAGRVVPERVASIEQYKTEILGRIYREMASLDPEGILAHEWINARGAIARFDRNAIEIRLIDNQECPKADLAIIQFVLALLDGLMSERWSTIADQSSPTKVDLETILLDVIRSGEDTLLEPSAFLNCFGVDTSRQVLANDLLWRLFEEISPAYPGDWVEPMRFILKNGCLARRLRRAVGKQVDRPRLESVYRRLSDCLLSNEQFNAESA